MVSWFSWTLGDLDVYAGTFVKDDGEDSKSKQGVRVR